MLVLSRRVGEVVDIGGGIIVEVLEVRLDKGKATVRLGFTAPGDVTIRRRELSERIARERGEGE